MLPWLGNNRVLNGSVMAKATPLMRSALKPSGLDSHHTAGQTRLCQRGVVCHLVAVIVCSSTTIGIPQDSPSTDGSFAAGRLEAANHNPGGFAST